MGVTGMTGVKKVGVMGVPGTASGKSGDGDASSESVNVGKNKRLTLRKKGEPLTKGEQPQPGGHPKVRGGQEPRHSSESWALTFGGRPKTQYWYGCPFVIPYNSSPNIRSET